MVGRITLGLGDEAAQLCDARKFFREALRPQTGGIVRMKRIVRSRKHDDWHGVEGVLTANPAQHIEARHPPHLDVEEAQQRSGRTTQDIEQRIHQGFATGEQAARIRETGLLEEARKQEEIAGVVVRGKDKPLGSRNISGKVERVHDEGKFRAK